MDLLLTLEKDVQDPAKLDRVKASVPTLMFMKDGQDKGFQDRAKKVESTLNFAFMKKEFDQAVTKESSAGNDLKAAVAAYDMPIKHFAERLALNAKDEQLLALYKQMVAKSDDICSKLFTPEFEASVPVVDCFRARTRAPGEHRSVSTLPSATARTRWSRLVLW
jgi:hypothetical protein